MDVVSAKSKSAVHFLDCRTFRSGEVLCGTPLDEKGHKNQTTRDRNKVTCKECSIRLLAEERAYKNPID